MPVPACAEGHVTHFGRRDGDGVQVRAYVGTPETLAQVNHDDWTHWMIQELPLVPAIRKPELVR